jgi:hypothetical protein
MEFLFIPTCVKGICMLEIDTKQFDSSMTMTPTCSTQPE